MSEITEYDSAKVAKSVWHLRKAGMSWDDVQQAMLSDHGVVLGMTEIHDLYRNFRSGLNIMYGPEERSHELAMEVERLNDLQAAWWDTAMGGNDVHAAKIVLETIKERSKLLGLHMPDATDQNITNNVLVIGESKEAWIEALEHGRTSKLVLPGPEGDDSDVGNDESEKQ